METVTTKRKNGMTHFCFKGKDVTALWMDFFSGLFPKEERKCVKLFIKKYGHILK